MTSTKQDRLVPFFLHPLPLGAVLLLVLNDHYLKYAHPSFLTGKISDFAGLFYFPLFLSALICLLVCKKLKPWIFWLSLIATDVVFVALKMHEGFHGLAIKYFSDLVFSVDVVMDSTDLWALLMNVPTVLWAHRFMNYSRTRD